MQGLKPASSLLPSPLILAPSVEREQDSWGWHGGKNTKEQEGELRGWKTKNKDHRLP